mmetsp:Transcript_12297/g.21064  ORF Transcript_12297/g.21064 Transcript_12297/m.21064 type:complete len:267 (+) Transcript_12297:1041-1841(+)
MRSVHARLHLMDDGAALDVQDQNRDYVQARRHREHPPEVEQAERHLDLNRVRRLAIDEAEEARHEWSHDHSRPVLHRVGEREHELALEQLVRLPAPHPFRWQADRLAIEAQVEETLAGRFPRVQHGQDAALGCDVGGDFVEHRLRGIRVLAEWLVDRVEEGIDSGAFTVVGYAAAGKEEDLIEGGKDLGRRLVNGAKNGCTRGRRHFLEKVCDGCRRCGVEARGRLVEDDDAWFLHEGDGKGQPAALAAREALEKHAPGFGVLAGL